MSYIIEAKGIKKTFVNGSVVTPVLKGIDFSVKEGEFVSIMGRSGAGKSTLVAVSMRQEIYGLNFIRCCSPYY